MNEAVFIDMLSPYSECYINTSPDVFIIYETTKNRKDVHLLNEYLFPSVIRLVHLIQMNSSQKITVLRKLIENRNYIDSLDIFPVFHSYLILLSIDRGTQRVNDTKYNMFVEKIATNLIVDVEVEKQQT